MKWDPNLDVFKFDVDLNFSPKHRKLRTGPDLNLENVSMKIPLTKRMILSQINGIYNPLGLSGPFSVRAKILMRSYGLGVRNHLVGMTSYQKRIWQNGSRFSKTCSK